MQAENFARLVDFVPDVTRPDNEQFARLNVMNNEGSLSDIYELHPALEPGHADRAAEETKKKIERFRGLLTSRRRRRTSATTARRK